jgi:hypothetical protein
MSSISGTAASCGNDNVSDLRKCLIQQIATIIATPAMHEPIIGFNFEI